jgi:hypothetical protein
MAQQPRKQSSSYSTPWKPQISLHTVYLNNWMSPRRRKGQVEVRPREVSRPGCCGLTLSVFSERTPIPQDRLCGPHGRSGPGVSATTGRTLKPQPGFQPVLGLQHWPCSLQLIVSTSKPTRLSSNAAVIKIQATFCGEWRLLHCKKLRKFVEWFSHLLQRGYVNEM